MTVAWLLSVLRPTGPYPILVIGGEQGSAKSTTSEALRFLVDPHTTPLRGSPHNERDLAIAAENSWVLAYDNLSVVKPWLSDTLCRVSTGAGFATRRLYTDKDELLISVARPILLNGIATEMVNRPDLLDRALVVELPCIPDSGRRTKAAVWRELEELRPAILGALLDVVAAGLRNLPTTRLESSPRMADFAVWIEACSEALGWPAGSFAGLYRGIRSETDGQALELWEVTPCLRKLLDEDPVLESTPAHLLKRLNGMADALEISAFRSYEWPRTPKALAMQLRQYTPSLRRVGIEVEQLKRSNAGDRVRITRCPVVNDTAGEVNVVSGS
jgi:hypothetical protein